MILDCLENAKLYRTLMPAIQAALDYLGRTDFSSLPDGRYELDGDNVFAIVQRYHPKPLEATMWEAHRKYIDVQFIAEGSERMGYAPLRDDSIVRQSYESDRDVAFYNVQGDLFSVAQGQFAVFMPCDIHAPGLIGDGANPPQNVCKVVVKCHVPES